jgi:hypothetical protein
LAVKRQPQFARLSFNSPGTALLHATETEVTIWDWAHQVKRASCQGRLLGQALSGQTFLTLREGRHAGAWLTESGAEVPLSSLSTDDYPLFARGALFCNEYPYDYTTVPQLTIYDVLSSDPPQVLSLPRHQGDWPENWALAPARDQLIYTAYGENGGHIFAYGRFMDLKTGQPVRDERFSVTRTIFPPPLFLSVEHDLLITGHQTSFNVYSLETGEALKDIWIYDGGGFVVAVHPQADWLFAANIEPYKSADLYRRGVRLIDTRSGRAERRIVRELSETARVDYLAFHPQGQVLASLLRTGVIHLWEVESGAELGTL